jgi:hypothetical protein
LLVKYYLMATGFKIGKNSGSNQAGMLFMITHINLGLKHFVKSCTFNFESFIENFNIFVCI